RSRQLRWEPVPSTGKPMLVFCCSARQLKFFHFVQFFSGTNRTPRKRAQSTAVGISSTALSTRICGYRGRNSVISAAGGTMNRKTFVSIGLAFLAALSVVSCATRTSDGLSNVENIVVIYAENRSFDHLYGLFPGAEGLAQASVEQKTQLDHDGKPLPYLPPVYDGNKVNPRF